jgi:hypothetical protein
MSRWSCDAPGFDRCYRVTSVPGFPLETCCLFGPGGWFVPARNDESCSACEGMRDLRARYETYKSNGGTPMGIRQYAHLWGPDNEFTRRVNENRHAMSQPPSQW